MRRIAVTLSIALSACATTANYEALLKEWIGAPETELISVWGPPSSVYQGPDSKFLTYNDQREVYVPGRPASYTSNTIGSRTYTQQTAGRPPAVLQASCATTFELRDGKVYGWRYQGNSCTSR